jgi:hypothetical protein
LKNGAECTSIYIFINSQNYWNRWVQFQNRHHSWIHIRNWYKMHIIMYLFWKLTKTSCYDHQTDITVELTLQISTECIYILADYQNYQNRLVQSLKKHYNWICIEKRYRMNINICWLSNLPKQVSPITK